MRSKRPTPTSVSYTHLDVYKRQELLELGLSVPQVTKIFLKLREMGVDVPADVYTIPYAVKMIPVSYTHLDVYKRQVQDSNL